MDINDYVKPNVNFNKPKQNYDLNLTAKTLDIYQVFQNRYLKTIYDKSDSTILALKYLKSRNITKNQIIKHGLGICNASTEEIPRSKTWSKLDVFISGLINSKNQEFFNNRITIPIKNEFGEVIGFSGRTYTGNNIRYLYSKAIKGFKYSKKSMLYNIEHIKNMNEVFLVEGFFDVFALENQGINNVLALMGIDISNEQIELLKKKNINKIILSLDNDNPGQEAMINIGKTLVENGFEVKLAFINDNEKDLSEYFNNGKSLKKYLNSIIDYQDYVNSNMKKESIHQKVKIYDKAKVDNFDFNSFFDKIGQDNTKKIVDIGIFPLNKEVIDQVCEYLSTLMDVSFEDGKNDILNSLLLALERYQPVIDHVKTKLDEFYNNVKIYNEDNTKIDYEILMAQNLFINATLRTNLVLEDLIKEGVIMNEFENQNVEGMENPNGMETSTNIDVNNYVKAKSGYSKEPEIKVNPEKPFKNKNMVDIVGSVGNGEKYPLTLQETKNGTKFLNIAIFTKHDKDQNDFDTVFTTLYGKHAEQVYNNVMDQENPTKFFRFKGTIETKSYQAKDGSYKFKNSPELKINSVETNPNLPYRNDIVVQGKISDIVATEDKTDYIVSIKDTYKFTKDDKTIQGSHELVDIIPVEKLSAADKYQDIAIKSYLDYNSDYKKMQLIDNEIVLGLTAKQKEEFYNNLEQNKKEQAVSKEEDSDMEM